jgi:uncharacterized protein
MFFPQEFSFFDEFEEQTACAVAASALFRELAEKGCVDAADLDRMRQIEHKGDEIAHTVIDRLNRIFITPFDRDDIYSLTKEIDDISDMLLTIVRRVHVYKVQGQDPNLLEFAAVIEESVRAVERAVKGLRNHKVVGKDVMDACVEVHRLENAGDAMRDAMLAQLFETERDPVRVIKLKEIYQDAETVLDICEDVAHVVQSILVKQA